MANDVHRASDVFGVSRDVPLNYVERPAVDSKFIDCLALDKHVIVYGSSKQGKTCLRKHCLSEPDFVLVQCQNGWGLEKLAEAILKEAGYKIEVTSERTVDQQFKLRASISVSLKALGFAESRADAGTETASGESEKRIVRPIDIDPSDPNDLVAALDQIEFDRF